MLWNGKRGHVCTRAKEAENYSESGCISALHSNGQILTDVPILTLGSLHMVYMTSKHSKLERDIPTNV